MRMKAKTREDVRREFRERGVTIRAWAEAHGWPYHAVTDVLYGRVRGNFGRGHEIAVALGLKRGEAAA